MMINTTITAERVRQKVQTLELCGIRCSSELLLPVISYTASFADPGTEAGAVIYHLLSLLRNIRRKPSPLAEKARFSQQNRFSLEPDRYGCMKDLVGGGARDMADFYTMGEAVTAVLEEALRYAENPNDMQEAAWHYAGVLQALRSVSDGIVGSMKSGNDKDWMMGWLVKINKIFAEPILQSAAANRSVFSDQILWCLENHGRQGEIYPDVWLPESGGGKEEIEAIASRGSAGIQ